MKVIQNLHFYSSECLSPFLKFFLYLFFHFHLLLSKNSILLFKVRSIMKIILRLLHCLIHFHEHLYFKSNLLDDFFFLSHIMTFMVAEEGTLVTYPSLITNTDKLQESVVLLTSSYEFFSLFIRIHNNRFFITISNHKLLLLFLVQEGGGSSQKASQGPILILLDNKFPIFLSELQSHQFFLLFKIVFLLIIQMNSYLLNQTYQSSLNYFQQCEVPRQFVWILDRTLNPISIKKRLKLRKFGIRFTRLRDIRKGREPQFINGSILISAQSTLLRHELVQSRLPTQHQFC